MHGMWVGLNVKWKVTQQQCVGVSCLCHTGAAGKTCFVFVLYSHTNFLDCPVFSLVDQAARCSQEHAAEDSHTEKQGLSFNNATHPGEDFCRTVTKVKHKAYLITAGAWRWRWRWRRGWWGFRTVSILAFLFLLVSFVIFAAVWLLLAWLLLVWLLLVWLLPFWLVLAAWLLAIFTIFLILKQQQKQLNNYWLWLGSHHS